MTLHRINHINGNVNMSQMLIAVFIATMSPDTPLQAIDLPPELPLWEKPPLDYTIRHDVKEQVQSHKARKLKCLEQRMAGILNAYDALLKP